MVMRMLLAVLALSAHPLHTTITELTEDRSHGVVRATIRVFADDFGKAKGIKPELDYVMSKFSFSDRAGRPLPLRSCGTRSLGELLWICVEAASAEGLAPLRVYNGMLSDLFDDQVNVVQGTVGGARRSVLFTKGDRAKALTGR
jgi:hypothetical protein